MASPTMPYSTAFIGPIANSIAVVEGSTVIDRINGGHSEYIKEGEGCQLDGASMKATATRYPTNAKLEVIRSTLIFTEFTCLHKSELVVSLELPVSALGLLTEDHLNSLPAEPMSRNHTQGVVQRLNTEVENHFHD